MTIPQAVFVLSHFKLNADQARSAIRRMVSRGEIVPTGKAIAVYRGHLSRQWKLR
jgi:hypothetical protein